MKERRTGQRRDRLLARVDQIGILGAGFGCGSHAKQTILGVQNDLAILRQMVRDERRQTDPEIHVRAVRNVASDARGHLLASEAIHAPASTLCMFRRRMPILRLGGRTRSPTGTRCGRFAPTQRRRTAAPPVTAHATHALRFGLRRRASARIVAIGSIA